MTTTLTDPVSGSLAAALRRSAELEAMIGAGAGEFRILTGDRPTGQLHLGHYFGTLRNRVRLQDAGAEVLVLDRRLPGADRPGHRRPARRVRRSGWSSTTWRSGSTPARSVIFAHSAVPELNQLLLPFLSLVTVPELQRNPTVKDEIANSRQASVSGLMFTYPAHQAADILFCKANLVPVGSGPAAARGGDPADRAPVQRAVPRGGRRPRSSRCRTRCCRTRRCCSAPTAGR